MSHSSDSDQDDLALFKEQKRIQIFKQNQVTKQAHLLNDTPKQQSYQDLRDNQNSNTEFNKFYGNQSDLLKKQITHNQKLQQPQINEEELSTKKLRAFNAAKYFQKIKLSFLKQIVTKTKQITCFGTDQIETEFCLFLSILPADILRICKQLKNRNPFTHRDSQLLQLFKRTFNQQNLKNYGNIASNLSHDSLIKNQTFLSFNNTQKLTKTQLIFKFSQFLNCKIRKINFFNIQNFVDESFYNLNFDKNQRRNQKSKKNATKLQQQIKNKIQRHLYQQQAQQKQQFVDLNDFSFSVTAKNMTKTEDEIKKQAKANKLKYQKIQEIKNHFMQETYQMFSFEENKWKMFIVVQNHFEEIQIDWFKQNILNGLPIVAFYSLQYLLPQKNYQNLLKLRKMGSIVIKDQEMYFGDDWKKIASRTKRVGLRPLMNKIYRFCNFTKPFDILKPFEALSQQNSLKQRKQILVKTQLPKTKTDFNLSTHFLTPSRVGKYHILAPEALPVDVQIGQEDEKIYWKDDLVPVCSRMGWIDFSRMVRNDESALKKTENRNKRPIQLYKYEQTQPYQLPIDESGNFILDPQHNSIYIPPDLKLPLQTQILTQKVSFICNKHHFKFAKLVQGFVYSGGMRVLPNQIGYIVYKKDADEILRLHEQRQQVLSLKKENRQQEKIQKMWRDLLKYVKLLQRMGSQF